MRRRLVALALVAIAVLAGGAAAAVERDDAPVPGEATASPVTPVLSARRVPALLAAPIADRRLATALDAVLAGQDGISCLAVSAAGRTVYEHNADVVMIPASVEKLFVAVAAIDVLGPDHRLRTTVVAASAPVDGVVAGDLYVVGGGDALLATADYPLRYRIQPQARTSVEALADAVVAAGVTRVEGRLLGDGSRYDSLRYLDVWPARYFEQDQTGPMSAMAVNDGWLQYPPRWDVSVPDEVPSPDPPAHAAGLLAELLGDRGVTVVGGVGSGAAPAGSTELAALESIPMREYVAHVVGTSDTHAAELLVKEIAVGAGRPGTSADGLAVVAEVLAELGLPDPPAVLADGSGLALENQTTCRYLRALLDRVGPDAVAFEGLPVAGQTGTLSLRLRESPATGRLRAKTGTLNQVTALAGYVATVPGSELAFSFLANLPPELLVDDDDLAVQADLAAALVAYPEAPPLAELGPLPIEDEVPDGG